MPASIAESVVVRPSAVCVGTAVLSPPVYESNGNRWASPRHRRAASRGGRRRAQRDEASKISRRMREVRDILCAALDAQSRMRHGRPHAQRTGTPRGGMAAAATASLRFPQCTSTMDLDTWNETALRHRSGTGMAEGRADVALAF
eukprot:350869-Chlamydomonas_euryale.AAC.5